MSAAPSANRGNGYRRDDRGRFVRGTRGGPGNPRADRLAEWRASFASAVEPGDVRDAAQQLVKAAKGGDLAAIRLLLERTCGAGEVALLALGTVEAPQFDVTERIVAAALSDATAMRLLRELLDHIGLTADVIEDAVSEWCGMADALDGTPAPPPRDAEPLIDDGEPIDSAPLLRRIGRDRQRLHRPESGGTIAAVPGRDHDESDDRLPPQGVDQFTEDERLQRLKALYRERGTSGDDERCRIIDELLAESSNEDGDGHQPKGGRDATQ